MVNRPFVQWFIRIWCVIMAVSILLTAISACLVVGMTKIVYTCSGENACIIQLDFANRQVRYLKYNTDSESRWMSGEMTDFMAVRLKLAAAVAKAPLWFGKYSNNSDEQADAWGMDMYFGGKVRTCQGVGDYPGGWNVLINKVLAIAKLFPETVGEKQVPGNISTVPL